MQDMKVNDSSMQGKAVAKRKEWGMHETQDIKRNGFVERHGEGRASEIKFAETEG
jgi:hypothetical protein